jgi:[acyl-carrier-protein] S-malonyltransferase
MSNGSITSWIFPGQGSQYLGMGRDLWSRPGRPLEIVEEAEQLSGFPLRQICWQGPDSELTRTDALQPALTAMSLGCAHLLTEAGLEPDIVAGHSLGEFPALCAAGVLSVSDCLRLVTARGKLMQKVAHCLNGGMGAVKRLQIPVLRDIIARLAPSVCIANHNSPDQVVISGANEALSAVAPEIAAAGGEFIRLAVAGPWHHPSMEDAALEFMTIVDATEFHAPRCPVYMNVSGGPETNASWIKELMRMQMASPVLWQSAIEAMFAAGATVFLEVGPGKVLRGLMRRIAVDESRYRIRGIESARSLQFLTTEVARSC